MLELIRFLQVTQTINVHHGGPVYLSCGPVSTAAVGSSRSSSRTLTMASD